MTEKELKQHLDACLKTQLSVQQKLAESQESFGKHKDTIVVLKKKLIEIQGQINWLHEQKGSLETRLK